jgi:hypothetical protein
MSSRDKAHGMRNEIAANGRCNADRHHKTSWSHRLLSGDVVEVLLQGRSHAGNEARSRATSLER